MQVADPVPAARRDRTTRSGDDNGPPGVPGGPWRRAGQLTRSTAGVSAIDEVRRLVTTTATTMITTAITATTSRIPALAPVPTENATMAGAISTETRFITLIRGLMAGPAVSLNGS